MDNAIIWNAHGVGNAPTVTSLKQIVSKYNPCLLAILEPMQPDRKRVSLGLKLGFHCSFSNGDQGGKVWIYSRNQLNALSVSVSNQMISLSCNFNNLRESLTLSVVYVQCCKIQRRSLWNEIEALSRTIQEPWAIAGDFNVVASSEERRMSRALDGSSMAEFSDMIHNSGLLDAGFEGKCFTWCNNREGNARVWARLDRVLLNSTWVSQLPLCRVEHLPRIISDHAPLRPSFPSQEPSKLMEEVFWKQKSRNSWLQEGDRNTNFFHSSANKRVRRAAITSIRNANGETISSSLGIKAEAIRFFEELFKAEPISVNSDFL
ncbi:uncharacterized protein LOC131254898 [Magnolia sinica]|uniref:uncharacterized protein LOC131254898 n=1 Tax=Magnolia sinica TaxID=86752 RepID=UPI00265A33D7|nr:uncharacterized protein LOC131254898 [Magnolia sinica]